MRRRDKEKGGSGTEIAPLPNIVAIILSGMKKLSLSEPSFTCCR